VRGGRGDRQAPCGARSASRRGVKPCIGYGQTSFIGARFASADVKAKLLEALSRW
jgi:hypothetical protein